MMDRNEVIVTDRKDRAKRVFLPFNIIAEMPLLLSCMKKI
jgi:hypothetical protein